jgi:hypothetical protein
VSYSKNFSPVIQPKIAIQKIVIVKNSFIAFVSLKIANNDLRANEGRETKALNCKPITNLKEKSELSNYCKTSGFLLHAVMCSLPFSDCQMSVV